MNWVRNKLIKSGVRLLVVFGALGMSVAKEVSAQDAVESFSISALGGPQFGSDGIGVKMNGQVRIGRSHTISKDDISGAGSFVNTLSSDDLKKAREVHRLLCENEERRVVSSQPSVPSGMVYSVTCKGDVKEITYRGRMDDLPSEVRSLARDFHWLVFESYVAGSRAEVKLDIAVDSIVRQQDKFLVSVKLINSGDFQIGIPSPRNTGDHGGKTHLAIDGKSTEKRSVWTAGLSGYNLANGAEFPGDTVTIPARGSVTFRFVTEPIGKIEAGTYSFDAQAVLSIRSDEFPVNTMGKVDFHSDYKNPTKVTIDRDYPSTPEEWKAYESRKAKEVTPVAPGASITEPGFYRATSGFETGALAVALQAGAAAPDSDIRFAKWQWVADSARAVTCKRGQTCPRDGRWVLGSLDFIPPRPTHQTFTQHQVSMRTGDTLPTLTIANVPDHKLYWLWLGL